MIVSEEQCELEQKMVGITIGNPRAVAFLINVSARPGTSIPIIRGSKCPKSVRARIMSLDAVMPYVDGERGARARLEQLHEATCTHYEKMLQEWRDRAEEDEEMK